MCYIYLLYCKHRPYIETRILQVYESNRYYTQPSNVVGTAVVFSVSAVMRNR